MKHIRMLGLAAVAALAFSALAVGQATGTATPTRNDEDSGSSKDEQLDSALTVAEGRATTTSPGIQRGNENAVHTVANEPGNGRKLAYEVGARDNSLM
jgi:hypothetical protein